MSVALNAELRRRLTAGAGLILPGVADALAARIAQAVGFPALYVTGAGIANSYLGAPDLGLVSVTELAAHVAAIREAVNVPIVVDADTGFGNALNVQRTVRLLERAGANALQIEDQVFPKRCGHFEGKEVIAASEMVQKIKAAADARLDASLMLIARTDARAVEGLDAALERAASYREAGADVLFVEAPQSVQELERIPKALPGLHVCNMVYGGKTPMLPRERLAEMGYAAIIYANAALQAAMRAVRDTLSHLHRHGSLDECQTELISFAARQEIVGHGAYSDAERRYAVPTKKA